MEDHLERVATFPDVTRAHLARGVLEAAGIQSELRQVDLNAVAGLVPASEAEVELWCASADVVRARKELAEDDAPRPSKPPGPSPRYLLVTVALGVAAALGWARVYQLSRPTAGPAGSWDRDGRCLTRTIGTATSEFCDSDRNGLWERGSSTGRNGLTQTWSDSDEDETTDRWVERDSQGALVTESIDTNKDGFVDETWVRYRDGSVLHSWRDEGSGLFSRSDLELSDGGVAIRSEDRDLDGRDDVVLVVRPGGLTIEFRDRDSDGFLEWREGRRGERVVFQDSIGADGVPVTGAGE